MNRASLHTRHFSVYTSLFFDTVSYNWLFETDKTNVTRALCFQMEKEKNLFCGLVTQESVLALVARNSFLPLCCSYFILKLNKMRIP